MEKVVLESIDQHVFDFESKILEILKPLLAGEPVTVDLNKEGPCAESIGLFSILDKLCSDFNINKNLISISTANAVEIKNKYKIVNANQVWLAYYKDLNFQVNKNIEKHFGIFIGRSNSNRLFLSAYAYKNHREKTIQTFHFSNDSPLQTGFDQLNELHHDVNQYTELTNDLLSNYPLKLEDIDSYPILTPAHMNIMKYYNNIFIDIVCETYYTGNTFFPTEKTLRPLLSETPFLIFGPVNYLANLKKLGFETFSDFWPEDYDDYDGITRCRIIADRIDLISRMSTTELNEMYTKMKPILEHNRNHLKTITIEKFYSTFQNV